MNAFEEHKDELEKYEQMFGKERGRLAVSLDRITNALVLVGQHGVYCTSQRNAAVPAMDLRMVVQELTHAKELVQAVMEEMEKRKS
jgi:xanthine dehydrogenase molybdopterin-binding subunit B